MRAREAAYLAINRIMYEGAYANICAASMLRSGKITAKDKALFVELVYGTVKAWGTLDWMIAGYTAVGRKIDKNVMNILRLGFYQLFFMERIPASAACNEAVELAKKYSNPGAAKFVNAIMRSAVRNPGLVVWPDTVADAVGYTALKYFHPQWLVERWFAQFGEPAAQELCRINNLPPELSVRVNTLKSSVDEAFLKLTAQGCSARRSEWAKDGLIISGHPALDNFSLLTAGEIQVQDESSQLAATVLAPAAGEFVIDCCAAPGGKTLHLAALMNNCGRIVACDLFEHKLKLIRDNAAVCGAAIIETQLRDARTIGAQYTAKADKILVDAPCSGLGVLRRKADLRWKKLPEQLSGLRDLQRQILNSAAMALKPGGELVYSTCTTESAENEAVVSGFLADNDEFTLLNAAERLPLKKKAGPMLNMRPFMDGTDGFFIALLRRDCV